MAKKVLLSLLAALLSFAPLAQSHALTVTVDAPLPAGVTDVTAMVPPGSFPAGASFFVFTGTVSSSYQLTFSVDQQPTLTVLLGGDVQSLVYDSAAGKVTMTLDFINFSAGSSPMPSVNAFVVGFIPADWDQLPDNTGLTRAELAQALTGAWMATTVLSFEIIPPTAGAPAFGFRLQGQPGATGFFEMFVPQAMVDLIAQFAQQAGLTADDLAVFENEAQTAFGVTSVAGGALVSIEITFAAPTLRGLSYATQPKTIVVAPKQEGPTPTPTPSAALTLEADKQTAAPGEQVTFSGVYAGAAEGTAVTLRCTAQIRAGLRRDKNFRLKTDAAGAFSKAVTFKGRRFTCRAEAKQGKKKVKSAKVVVTKAA